MGWLTDMEDEPHPVPQRGPLRTYWNELSHQPLDEVVVDYVLRSTDSSLGKPMFFNEHTNLMREEIFARVGHENGSKMIADMSEILGILTP